MFPYFPDAVSSAAGPGSAVADAEELEYSLGRHAVTQLPHTKTPARPRANPAETEPLR